MQYGNLNEHEAAMDLAEEIIACESPEGIHLAIATWLDGVPVEHRMQALVHFTSAIAQFGVRVARRAQTLGVDIDSVLYAQRTHPLRDELQDLKARRRQGQPGTGGQPLPTP